MKIKTALRVLLKLGGDGYGPKAPGYRYGTAIAALDRMRQYQLHGKVAGYDRESIVRHRRAQARYWAKGHRRWLRELKNKWYWDRREGREMRTTGVSGKRPRKGR